MVLRALDHPVGHLRARDLRRLVLWAEDDDGVRARPVQRPPRKDGPGSAHPVRGADRTRHGRPLFQAAAPLPRAPPAERLPARHSRPRNFRVRSMAGKAPLSARCRVAHHRSTRALQVHYGLYTEWAVATGGLHQVPESAKHAWLALTIVSLSDDASSARLKCI